MDDETREFTASIVRLVDGVVLIVALVIIAWNLHKTMDNSPANISAVQIVQVYTQSLYQVVTATAVCIAVYIASKVWD